MNPSNHNFPRRIVLCAGALALVSFGLIGPAQTAKADPGNWDYYPSCRNYTANIFSGSTAPTYELTTHTVPASSGCSDINSIAHDCQNHRIRFYPSGGGSYVNSWKFDCDGANVIASGVTNGTVYRSEGSTYGYFHIED